MLPDQGYALNREHGIVKETHHVISAPFLSLYFKGNDLNRNALPLNIFKTLVDEAYASIWRIFTPAIYELFATERELRKIVNIPIREPAFNSLLIEIEQPAIDVSAMKDPEKLDIEDTNARLRQANTHFLEVAYQISKIVDMGGALNRITDENFDVLAIVSQLAPTDRSYYDLLEISGRTIDKKIPTILINAEAGELLRYAYKAALEDKRTITGVVVEISARSSTFIIRTSQYREITCVPVSREVFEQIAPLVTGTQVRVTGSFIERKRRDRLDVSVLEITGLPGGQPQALML